MIDSKTKNKFLKELEKNGNVFWSCAKTNIHRSTYYRWVKMDKEFKQLAKTAICHGRENNTDIGEHALMLKIKDKNMDAIKYLLGHNSSRYKRQVTHAIIMHKKDLLSVPVEKRTLEDLLAEGAQRRKEHEDAGLKKVIDNNKPKKKDESGDQTNKSSDSDPTST